MAVAILPAAYAYGCPMHIVAQRQILDSQRPSMDSVAQHQSIYALTPDPSIDVAVFATSYAYGSFSITNFYGKS
jgi:hypothetical protein